MGIIEVLERNPRLKEYNEGYIQGVDPDSPDSPRSNQLNWNWPFLHPPGSLVFPQHIIIVPRHNLINLNPFNSTNWGVNFPRNP